MKISKELFFILIKMGLVGRIVTHLFITFSFLYRLYINNSGSRGCCVVQIRFQWFKYVWEKKYFKKSHYKVKNSIRKNHYSNHFHIYKKKKNKTVKLIYLKKIFVVFQCQIRDKKLSKSLIANIRLYFYQKLLNQFERFYSVGFLSPFLLTYKFDCIFRD